MANTADVSWTSSGSSWEYIVLTATDDTPGESDTGTAVSSTSVSLSGLTEVTDYAFYVRNICSGENSGWVAGYFRTACADLFTLPFNEGFNNGGEPPTYMQFQLQCLIHQQQKSVGRYLMNLQQKRQVIVHGG